MQEWLTLSICAVTAVVTHLALRNPSLKGRLLFRPHLILGGQWDRLFGSALIHADWVHAGFNLFAFYSFGGVIEMFYGWHTLLMIYLGSILGGGLLSLYLHRQHDYAALGASGGVAGVVFATIFMIPGTGVGMLFIPVSIPGNLFALLYLGLSFYGLRKGVGNVGHDAHFGGAVVGLAAALFIVPEFCFADPFYFGGAALLSIFCLGILYLDPLNLSGKALPNRMFFKKKPPRFTGNLRYDDTIRENARKREIDEVLDKVSKFGIQSLDDRERAILQSAARKR